MMKLILLALLLVPCVALAQEKAPPSPEMQSLLYLKQAAEQRELDATLSAFRFKAELDALKAKPADNKTLTDGFAAQIKKLRDELAAKDGEIAIANTRMDEARNAMTACPK